MSLIDYMWRRVCDFGILPYDWLSSRGPSSEVPGETFHTELMRLADDGCPNVGE